MLQSMMFSRVQQCTFLVIEIEYILIHVSGMVYGDAEKLYAEVRLSGESLIEEALSILFPESLPFHSTTTSKINFDKIIGYNTTFLPRWDVITIPLDRVNSALKAQILQVSDDGKEGYAVMQTPAGNQVGHVWNPNCTVHTHLLPASGM